MRYTTRQEVPTAVVLAWNHNATNSALIEVNLSNFQMNRLLEVSTTQDQPKNKINLFEFVHGYLMVALINGFVSIYKYPDTSVKIGGIFHQNTISDIV